MNNIYYVYAYLRKNGTPYYIGKGSGNRFKYRNKTEINPPKDSLRTKFLKENLSEDDAFMWEVFYIAEYGRKDLGTGILRNKTDGGEGVSGYLRSDEWRRNRSKHMKGRPAWNKGKTTSLKGKTKAEIVGSKEKADQLIKENAERAKLRVGEKHHMHGKHWDEESNKKRSASGKKVIFTDTRKENMRKAQYKIADVKCPYCNKEGKPGPMGKHHFNNCKFK